MANKYAGTKTEQNLRDAFAGESQARNKYTYFASKAKKEGYEQISALFLSLRGKEVVQVDGLELFAGQGLLEGRELQYASEDSRHGAVVGKGLVVEDQVLEGSLFDGLQDEAVGAVDRGDHFDRPALQGDGLFGAVSGADPAAQTDGLVDDGSFFLPGNRA